MGRLHSLVEHLLCSITLMMYSQFWVMFRTRQYMHYRSFSHDITAAILVYITNKRVQKNHVAIKLFSHVRTFFCTKKFALYYFLLSIRRSGRPISEKLSRSRLSEWNLADTKERSWWWKFLFEFKFRCLGSYLLGINMTCIAKVQLNLHSVS